MKTVMIDFKIVNGKKVTKNVKKVIQTIDAIYDDGTVRTTTGDIYTVRKESENRYTALN